MRSGRATTVLLGTLLVFATRAGAEVPGYEGEFFTDLTHRVAARDQVEISRTLRVAAQSSRVHPMLVVIDHMSSYPTAPQEIGGFATALINEWKVGDVDTKKGVLVLFSIDDRRYFVGKTTNVDQSVTDSISRGFASGTLAALKQGDLTRAMSLAARNMASALPAASSTTSSAGAHTVTRTTHTHQVTPTVTYNSSSSSSPIGCFTLMIILIVGMALLRAFAGRSYYSGGYYGGGYGGGGFGSGFLTGGLLGYLFGSSGSSSWGSSGWTSDASYTDTTTTDSWSSGSDNSSGGGGFDSFGGGSSDGGGSGGSW
jgi:uncharacterized membrane protein YgcG